MAHLEFLCVFAGNYITQYAEVSDPLIEILPDLFFRLVFRRLAFLLAPFFA